jgi:hypothetical protein
MVALSRTAQISGLAGNEDVAPVVARSCVVEHVDALSLRDFESRGEDLEPAGGWPAFAGDEDAIARVEDRGFARLVVPLGGVTGPGMVQVACTSP